MTCEGMPRKLSAKLTILNFAVAIYRGSRDLTKLEKLGIVIASDDRPRLKRSRLLLRRRVVQGAALLNRFSRLIEKWRMPFAANFSTQNSGPPNGLFCQINPNYSLIYDKSTENGLKIVESISDKEYSTFSQPNKKLKAPIRAENAK